MYYRVCCFVLFSLAASASFNGYYTLSHLAEQGVEGFNVRATFESMLDGTAYRPYVYRRLLPDIANRLDSLVPRTVKDKLYNRQRTDSNAVISAISTSPTARNKKYFSPNLLV